MECKNKIINMLKKSLNNMLFVFTGLTASSLLLSKCDNWKIYLPICLACIVVARFLDEE
jgi:hypothetical protein